MAKSTEKKRYTVKHPLVHDNERFDEGDTVELSEEHAPALVRRGIIVEPKVEKAPPADKAAKK
jgi:hypothetical protein